MEDMRPAEYERLVTQVERILRQGRSPTEDELPYLLNLASPLAEWHPELSTRQALMITIADVEDRLDAESSRRKRR